MNIHFAGIGGSGVSAIAGFMAEKGHTISGSDRAFETNPAHPVIKSLLKLGITLHPQDGSGIKVGLDLLVTSTAVEQDNPELIAAHSLDIPIMTRPEQLAGLVAEYKTIAVSGTSGKSTTSGILAYVMHRMGLGPNFIGGGRVGQFQDDTHAGNYITGPSDTLVIEACESDGSIIHYIPEHTIVLNLDLDHHGIEETALMFTALLNNTRGLKVMNADDTHLLPIIPQSAIRFSIKTPSDYQARDIDLHALGSEFTVNGQRYRLHQPGLYNVMNALGVIALMCAMGNPAPDIALAIEGFKGISRRFEIYLNEGRYLVLDDYAHNPHKIASLMQAAQSARTSICYIFQPHGFEPTRLMKDGYIEAFSGNLRPTDHLILLPIFYAGGTVARDISSQALAEGISKAGISVEVIADRADVLKTIGKWDGYIVMGARDETLAGLAHSIADKLSNTASGQ